MSNIVIRTITGIIFVIAIIGSILWHPFAFGALFLVFSLVTLIEFLTLTSDDKEIKNKMVVLVTAVLLYSLFFLTGNNLIPGYFLVCCFAVILIMVALEMMNRSPEFKNIVYHVFGLIYIIVPFGLLNLFYGISGAGHNLSPWLLLSYFGLVWVNDIFAYLTGSIMGRHKLLEHISPKKTWEGFAGGLLFSLLSAWTISYFIPELSVGQWLGLAAITVVTGVLGDLAESLLKRNADVKDSGTMLPGHGGFRDRFDAMLLSAPAVFIYLSFIIT